MNIKKVNLSIITNAKDSADTVARIAIFIIYFWFGILKILDLSPASPLATALVSRTIGSANFVYLFIFLGAFECLIGILFLLPRFTRVVIPLMLIHLVIVCSPLILLGNLVWQYPFVPTLEGQYIIKNVALIALALVIVANTKPIAARNKD